VLSVTARLLLRKSSLVQQQYKIVLQSKANAKTTLLAKKSLCKSLCQPYMNISKLYLKRNVIVYVAVFYQQLVIVGMVGITVQACCGCSDHQAGQAQQAP
jgi:hypothetical protein